MKITMSNQISLKCAYCNGSIIQKYDKIYCIQCSREPVTEKPATISEEDYIQDRRGDTSIKHRIEKAAQQRENR